MDVWFKTDSYTYSEGHDHNDEWARASTSTTWEIDSYLYLNKDKSYSPYSYEQEFIPDETLKSGDTVYMTYVVYSTGDSFGHDSGANFEPIGFYKNKSDAEKAKELIKNAPDSYDWSNEDGFGLDINIPTYDGTSTRKQSCAAWTGYFERLDYVEVLEMRVI